VTTPAHYRVDGPLPPPGRVIVEASAGTGKTYALAALATRLVAEGEVGIDELLVVTFTRAAAAELRDRIRRRLVGAARLLSMAPGPERDTAVGTDQLHQVLSRGPAEEVDARRGLLERAVMDFDTATITTIHGFCNQVLLTLGVTGAFNPDAVLVQDTRQLIRGVCTDVMAERSLAGRPWKSVTKLTGWVGCVLNNPGLRIEARSGKEDDLVARDLVDLAARQVRDRLVATGSVSFDGLLENVRDALADDPSLARRIADQFPAALIDEFQDTDPVQWDLFRCIYTGDDGADRPGTRLILVGDPKQAIYAFRGGDIHTYLAAVERAATTLSLPTNWRSDGAVLRAMNALCGGLTLGDDRIEYLQVEASPAHQDRRLVGRNGTPLPALDLRCVLGEDLERNQSGGIVPEAGIRAAVPDLVERIAALLDGGATVDGRPIEARDVAVLVHAHRWSPVVQRALAHRGIPAVISGGSSVAESPAAEQWQILVDALVRPADASRARALALSWFAGWEPEAVAGTGGAGDDPAATDLAALQARAESWATVLRDQGVAALVAAVWRDGGVAARLLATADGERNLTDLEHLGELLHAASGGHALGPESLRALLDGLAAGTDDDDDPEAIKRRIASDAAAVTVMTAHAAKGLEFPVVCCPTLWSLRVRAGQRVFHDDDTGERVLDVSASSTLKAVKPAHAAARREIQGQNDRLTYVALTRAVHQTVLWWCPAGDAGDTALAAALFGRVDEEADLPEEADTVKVLRRRVAGLGLGDEVAIGLVDVGEDRSTVPTRAAVGSAGPDVETAPGSWQVATLGRDLDRRAGRWSFTAVTSRADDDDHRRAQDPVDTGVPVGVDPDDPSLGDAGAGDEQRPPPPVLFDGLGAGAAFGTLVHDVFEHLDFTGDVTADVARYLGDRPWALDDPASVPALSTAIAAAVRTPLGDAFGGVRLADVADPDRLDELDFELPLGIDRSVAVSEIGALVLDHVGHDDPIGPWARDLAGGMIDVDLAGYLTGSIDLVLRLSGPSGSPRDARFCVVDYKTNRLGTWGEPDVVANYHPDRLAPAMAEHHYPLQFLLYSVALHRYLRWRLPDYAPDRHLGPAGYLFVRGMVGEDTPVVGGRTSGVFDWTAPAGLVPALSDLLHGGAS
jgi:exodeoxyribonuclease V beta subunit